MKPKEKERSEQIRDFIKETGLTRRQASEKLEIDLGTLGRLMRGEGRAEGNPVTGISLDKLDKLLREKLKLEFTVNGKRVDWGFNWGRVPLGEQVRRMVVKSGIERSRICREAEISQSLLSRFMAGDTGISLRTLDALGKVLKLGLQRNNFALKKAEQREKQTEQRERQTNNNEPGRMEDLEAREYTASVRAADELKEFSVVDFEKSLNLTDEQRDKIEKIRQESAVAVKKYAKIPHKLRKVYQEAAQKIRDVLTDESL